MRGHNHPRRPCGPDVELDWKVYLLHADLRDAYPSLVGTSPGRINSHSIWREVRPDPGAQRRGCGASRTQRPGSNAGLPEAVSPVLDLTTKHCIGRMNLGQEPLPVCMAPERVDI